MLDFISKRMYWADLANPVVMERMNRTTREMICLKHIQDSWIIGRLGKIRGKRILEVGGGFGRVLRTLDGNERWNLDVSAGVGRSVGDERKMPKEYRLVPALLGEYSPDLPNAYFDVLFSISVMEHIPPQAIPDFWRDHARIMAPGAVGYHAVDFYLGDEALAQNEQRIESYIEGVTAAGLEFIKEPAVRRPMTFRAGYASNPDLTMLHWNTISPTIKNRHNLQSVSLGLGVRKPSG